MFTSQGLPKGLQTLAGSKDNPRQWCEGLSEKRTYIRFVDSFRLRTEDEYTFRGDASGLYADEDPMPYFKRYLKKAKAKGLMPGEGLASQQWKISKSVLFYVESTRMLSSSKRQGGLFVVTASQLIAGC